MSIAYRVVGWLVYGVRMLSEYRVLMLSSKKNYLIKNLTKTYVPPNNRI